MLLSIGQFCDSGFTATFTATHLTIYRDNTIFLQGQRNTSTGMWYIDLENQQKLARPAASPSKTIPAPEANNVYEINNKRDIITYLHKACFSPVPSTWIKAIDAGFFATWPGLTSQLVRHHLQKSEATIKGHLRTARANQRSTKPKVTTPPNIPQMTTPRPNPRRSDNRNVTSKLSTLAAKYTATRPGASPMLPAKAANTSWSSMMLIPTPSSPSL